MTNVIAILAIALIVGGAVFYLIRAKKRGQKCIGCPYCKECSGHCTSHKSENNENKKQ